METDRQMLIWFHERFVHVYKESELLGYLHRLRAIIAATPKNKYTPTRCLNSMADLQQLLDKPKKKGRK